MTARLADSASPPATPLLRVRGLGKSYPAVGAGGSVELFRDLDMDILPGEIVAVVGASGAGKSTLLHLLAALDTPTAGEVSVNGVVASSLSPRAAALFRNRTVGYLWQAHYLLPEFTAAENVALPLLARGVTRRNALASATNWLARVGLAGREHHRAGELSGGEQQRAALARALSTEPKLLLADEPTGDLDHANAERILSLLLSLGREQHLSAIIVTHSLELAERCDRVLRLESGSLRPL